MTQDTIDSLGTLVRLRGTEVERLQADLRRQAERPARATRPTWSGWPRWPQAAAPPARWPPALALNCGQYKQAVLAMADAHRIDLQLHEANMAVAQRHLNAAWIRRELLGKVLEQHQARSGANRNARRKARRRNRHPVVAGRTGRFEAV